MRPVCEIDFCYGHRLLNYDGKCRHLHGHSARVAIGLEQGADQDSVSRQSRQWVQENLTRRMILRRDDPAIDGLRELGEPLYLLEHNPTTENLARLLFHQFRELSLPVESVRVWESPRCSATYRPDA